MFLFRSFLSFIAVGVHFGSSIASNQDALNIRAFNFFVDSLNEGNFTKIMSNYDPQRLQYHTLPTSLGIPVQNFTEHGAAFQQSLDMFQELKVSIFPGSLIESAESNTITVHAQSNGITHTNVTWHNEYIWIAGYGAKPASGFPKITSFVEFIDTGALAAFTAAETASESGSA
ncbi:hypothetical protein B0H14DRAFT_2778333 [Mycena olivaceomarginata]|nr:hypothetical protein B0H14DRAFT_2778333 [Mycena olivaceomarginata]